MLSENKILSGKYKIIEKLGQGGMAEVYKAENLENGAIVAVKVLKHDLCEDEKSLQKFQKEAVSAALLHHENIVRVFEYGEDEDIHYIAMELVNGNTLKAHITEKGHLGSTEILRVAACIAKALREAHGRGIIHRDIKPQNILMNTRGVVKVADFGIARATTASTLTTQREAIGSVHYMPPEQAKGQNVDARSDLYSLGITMFEMATGQVPFDGETPVAIAIQHLNKPFPNPLEMNPELNPGLADCILKLTQKNPDNRYQSADELLSDLEALEINPTARIEYVTENETEEKKEDPVQVYKRRKMLVGFGTAGIALGLILLFVMVYNGLCNQIKEKIITIPSLYMLTEEQAKQTAKAAGHSFAVEGYSYSDTVEKGCVVSQSPTAELETESYTQIRVVLSLGQRQTATVPNLIGMSYADAFEKLSENGISFTVILTESQGGEAGTVCSQYPDAGVAFKEDKERTMTVYISQVQEAETITVPSVIGIPLEQAIQMLMSKGCACGLVSYETHSTYEKGTVIAQGLPAGFLAQQDAEIDLTVSSGPDTAGKTVRSGGALIISNIGSTGVEETLGVYATLTDGSEKEIYYAEHVTESTFAGGKDFLVIDYPDGTVYLKVRLNGVIVQYYTINSN